MKNSQGKDAYSTISSRAYKIIDTRGKNKPKRRDESIHNYYKFPTKDPNIYLSA